MTFANLVACDSVISPDFSHQCTRASFIRNFLATVGISTFARVLAHFNTSGFKWSFISRSLTYPILSCGEDEALRNERRGVDDIRLRASAAR